MNINKKFDKFMTSNNHNWPYTSLQNSLAEVFSNFLLNNNCCLIPLELIQLQWLRIQHFWCSFLWFAWDTPFIWELHFGYHWRNLKPCIIFANVLLINRSCSFEVKGVFVRDNKLEFAKVQSPKIKYMYLPVCDKRNQTQPIKRKRESLTEL